ncbi:hypothetical protein DFH06DRAFT_1150354 [Mycena polygramma]|nr:hypothetical protein DFH06DRAFT_1150354 [Mycena polygramma]
MTAQELLVQSESANNSSEEKSEIIGKARKFEMPIPPLRSQRDRRVKGEKLGEPETRQQERSGCWSATGLVVDSSMRGSKGAEASDEVPEEPKHLTNQSWEATGKTEANARMFGRVPMARAAEAEHDRKESPNGEMEEAEKAMKPKTPRSAQRNKKSMEDLGKEEPEGAEQFPAKGCCPELKCTEPEVRPRGPKVMKQKPKSRMSLSEARPRSGMAGKDPGTSDAQPKTATVFGRRPDLSSEHENGKETANGGEQPRTTPDASAEASIGRSEVTNGRLESEPRKGDEQRTEVQGTKVERRRAESGTGPRVPTGRKLAKESERRWQREAPEVRIWKPGVSRANIEEFGRRSDTSPDDLDKSRRVECSRRTRNPEVDRVKLRRYSGALGGVGQRG